MMLALGCVSRSTTDQAARGPPDQSLAEAMRLMCEVDGLAKIDVEENPINVAQLRADWLYAHIQNPDAIYLRTIWSVKPAAERARAMREAAAKAGIRRCTLADTLEREGDF